MSNNDKFIIDTKFGKLMESSDDESCLKCKYIINNKCTLKNDGFECLDDYDSYYFAKDETDETEKVQGLQK